METTVGFVSAYCEKMGLRPSYEFTKDGKCHTCVCRVEGTGETKFLLGEGSAYEARAEEMCSEAATRKVAEKRAADARHNAQLAAAGSFIRNNGLEGWD